MLETLKRFFLFLHGLLYAVFVRFFLQTVLAQVLLFLVYFFVLGPTAVIVRAGRIFSRNKDSASTTWQPARGYDPSLEESARQS